MTKIWLVEDEQTIADALIYKLEEDGFEVLWFERGQLLINELQKQQITVPNLIILDIGLPDIIGFELASLILKQQDIPIIFLTARNDEVDRVAGLEMGADDYITKPFSPKEVLARIHAVLRRYYKQPQWLDLFEQGDFILNEESATVYYYQKPLCLTRYEYLLLKIFIRSPNRVFSRSQLMELVWQDNLDTMERTVDTHIKTIRQKLMVINDHYQPIQTHRGLGYSLNIA